MSHISKKEENSAPSKKKEEKKIIQTLTHAMQAIQIMAIIFYLWCESFTLCIVNI